MINALIEESESLRRPARRLYIVIYRSGTIAIAGANKLLSMVSTFTFMEGSSWSCCKIHLSTRKIFDLI